MKYALLFLTAGLANLPATLPAQAPTAPTAPPSPAREARQQATRLDGDGRHAEAQLIWQAQIDGAVDPAARAAAQRRMAMSHGFAADCGNAVRYHEMVIDYWKTRENEEPQNAFYQEGEMANESARVCIDAGDLDTAERMYRRGYELGNREPAPRTHPKSLWDFRMAHAMGRIAARRGNGAEAERQVTAARRALDGDPAMAADQERFFSQLVGYVALYTGKAAVAEPLLTGALAIEGNQRDAFLHCLLASAFESMGQPDRARELYQQAHQLAEGSHTPPAAYARRVAREKLGK